MRCIIAVAIGLLSSQARAESLHLSDGDSFTLGAARYRLHGIDAPELHQECYDPAGAAWPCGRHARSELRRIIGTEAVVCKTQSVDRFGRNVATCTAGGRDIAEEMVRAGYATAHALRGGVNPYGSAERKARLERRGIWAGRFDPPHEWRRKHPREEDEGDLVAAREWLRQNAATLWRALARWREALFGR